MDQLKLLKDYVATMQRQVQSKNAQIRTLTDQNQQLLQENYQLSSRTQSYSLTGSTICLECPQTKTQLANLHEVYNLLQSKYDQLEKQKLITSSSSSSVRVISTSCTECVKLRRDNEELREKYDAVSRKYEQQLQNKSISSKTYITSFVCNECPNLKLQINQKNELIHNLKNQLSTFNTKILTLQGQINTLNATAPKQIVYQQTVSKQSDLQKITYLNNQIEQYIAVINSSKSEINQLSEENHLLALRMRELEARPKEVQFIEKEISPQMIGEIKSLKIQIGELSNDNIVLRRQNATLKREIMNLQLPKNHHFIELEKPRASSFINLNDQRRGKHFKKPNTQSKIAFYNNQTPIIIMDQQQQQMPYQQRIKYNDISRKIQLLQMENDYLRGTFYSKI